MLKKRARNTKSIVPLFVLIFLIQPMPLPSQSPIWQLTSLDSVEVSCFATSTQGDIFAGARWEPSPGLYRSSNNGDDWDTLNIGFPRPRVWCLLSIPNGGIFAGIITIDFDTTNSGTYYSSDNGGTWQRRSSFVPDALISSDTGRTFFAGTYYGVFRSNDTCRTWTRLTTPADFHSFTAIAITQMNSILTSAIRYNIGHVLRSTDEGQTWTVHQTWSEEIITAFLIPAEGNIFLTAEDGVNRSADDGQTWYWRNNGIPPGAAYWMQTLAMDSNGTIYAGAWEEYGVYRSTDTGWTWSEWNNGLENRYVEALIVNSQGYLFAGTLGGVYRSINPVTSVSPNKETPPTSFSLSQNYPNPFNPSTTIRFEVPVSRFMLLTIYNVLGQVVATLVNEVKQPGVYSVEWNGSGQPSGVYFYRIQAGNYVETKKLLLLK